MQFSQFLLILIARYKIIFITFALTVLGTLVVSLLIPKSYKATTSLILNYKGMDPVTGVAIPAQLMPGYMATQVDIITSRLVAGKVVDSLNIAENVTAKAQFEESSGKGDIRDWYAQKLLKNLDVQPSRESSVIEVSFTGADPEFSAVVANAFAAVYQETSLLVKTEPSQKAATYLDSQINILRKKLDEAQNKVSKYQQEKGITSGEEQLDIENAKLNQLSQQLIHTQEQSIQANSKRNNAQSNSANSPDVTSNSLVMNLKAEIARAESRLADDSERYGVNHPQYLSSKAEVNKLRSELYAAIKNISASVSGSAQIINQSEAELRAQVAAQKTKLLALNRSRNQLTMLQKDVENAQRSLDLVNQRYTQTNLEGQGSQTDIAVLNAAIPPTEPSSPKVLLNLALAIFLGSLFGIGFALISELLDKRVRSVEDILEYVDLPVLGVIGGKVENKRNLLLLKNLTQI